MKRLVRSTNDCLSKCTSHLTEYDENRVVVSVFWRYERKIVGSTDDCLSKAHSEYYDTLCVGQYIRGKLGNTDKFHQSKSNC